MMKEKGDIKPKTSADVRPAEARTDDKEKTPRAGSTQNEGEPGRSQADATGGREAAETSKG